MRQRKASVCLFTLIPALLVILCRRTASAEPQWQSVAPLPTGRVAHAGVIVGNRWYVAGGVNLDAEGVHYLADVNAYDPSLNRWELVGQLTIGREYIVGVVGPVEGTALFVGGFVPAGPAAYQPLDACDVVSANDVAPTGSLLAARYLHAAASVGDSVLVAGGWGGTTYSTLLDTAELLDATTQTWRSAGVMPAGTRSAHSMTTLADGIRVLVVGGCLPDRAMIEADQYDAQAGGWTTAADLNLPRCRHAAVRLKDGRVLVSGSLNLLQVDNSVEIFDRGTWTQVASMSYARYDHDMALLPDGRVLVAGGTSNPTDGESGALSSVEIYNPATDQWSPAPAMHDARRWPRLAVLSDGVYVAGGSNGGGTLASVERLTWSDLGVTAGDPSASGCSCHEVPSRIAWPEVLVAAIFMLLPSRRRKPCQRAEAGEQDASAR